MMLFLGFVLLLAVIVIIRVKTNGKFEIKTNDLVVALVPIVLILFMTGQIDKIKIGDLEIEKALKEAYDTGVKNDISDVDFASEKNIKDDLDQVRTERKGSVAQLNLIKDKNTEGLVFALGYQNYAANVIKQYFRTLPTLKYVVINDQQGDFVGMLDAQVLKRYCEQYDANYTWSDFERTLRRADLTRIKTIPSYISNEHAVNQDEKRLIAMEKFKSSKLNLLPVVHNGQFVGVLERDNLANEILIGLSASIQSVGQ